MLILRLGSLRLELQGETLRCGVETIPLNPTAVRLLGYLANNRDRVVPTEELLREVWPGVRVTLSSVQQAVHTLRRAVGAGSDGATLIRTVRGRGYQLIAPVEEVEERGGGHALPFVGRAGQLGRLLDALENARAGRGGLALVSGPPGIGKTRLLQELEALGARRGFLFLSGHCPEESGAAALWPWEEILRGVLDRDPGALGAAAPPDLAALGRAFPVLGAGLDSASASLDAGAARFRLYEAVRRVLVACARERPLVVAIDDLHRADETSLRLLEWIAGRNAGEQILLAAAYRDLPAERDPVLRSAMGGLLRLPGSSVERLSPLTRDDVEEATRSALGGSVSIEETEALWRRSAGNPFFLGLLIHHALLDRDGARSTQPELLPEAGEAVRQHLEGMAPGMRDLLSQAAVLGREFDADVLASLAGAAPEDVSATIEEACAAGLVELLPRGAAHFVHALVVEALYESLDAKRRIALHARAAEILEGKAESDASALGALAGHAWQAAPQIGDARAAGYCERAAQSALGRYAFEEAARLYGQALELSQDAEPRRRVALLLALGESRARAGQVEAATEALRQAIDLAKAAGDDESQARAVLALALMREDEDDSFDGGWIRTLEEAVDAHLAETSLRAQLLSRLAAVLWRVPPPERSQALARESIELARRSEDADALAAVLVRAYRILQTGKGHDAPRIEIARELAAVLEHVQDPIVAVGGRICLLMDALIVGNRRALDEHVTRIVLQAEEVGAPQAEWCALVARASRAHLMGQLDGAEQLTDRALEIGESVGLRVARQNHVLALITIRWDQGRLEELVPLLAPAAESPSYPMPWRIAWSLAKLAGDAVGPAREMLREFCADPDRLPVDVTYAAALYMLADITGQLADLDAAEILVPLTEELRGLHAMVGLGYCHWGAMERPLGCLYGLLEQWDEAQAALEAGLASDRRFGAVAAVARGQRDLGALLARRGRAADRPRARTLLQEAHSLAHALGMIAIVQICAELLSLL